MKFADLFDGWDAMPPELEAVPHRCGHWFFVPAIRRRVRTLFWIHERRDAPLAAFVPDGTTASEVVRICARCLPPHRPLDRPEIYVRGNVLHPGSPMLVLSRWHRAFRVPTSAEVAARRAVLRGLATGSDSVEIQPPAWTADESLDPLMHRLTLELSQRLQTREGPGPDLVSLGIVATVEGDTDVGIRQVLVDPAGVCRAAEGESHCLKLFTCSCGLPSCGGFSYVRMSATGDLVTWRWRHGPWRRRAVFGRDTLQQACAAVMEAYRKRVEQFRLMGVEFMTMPRYR